MNQNLYKKILFAVIILTTSFILIYFGLKKLNNNDISLIKDLLGIASTLFTAIVAIFLFQDWTIQKKLESLSNHANESISLLPQIYLNIVNFTTNVEHYIQICELYKNNKNPNLLDNIEKLSDKLFKHQFMDTLYNFEIYFNEISSLMNNQDKSIYLQLSESIKEYKTMIFNEKILNTNNHSNSNDLLERNLKLRERMLNNLSIFKKKLIQFKNYNY